MISHYYERYDRTPIKKNTLDNLDCFVPRKDKLCECFFDKDLKD